LEPQRKNEVLNSEGVVETEKEVTLTVNHGIAPDGTKSSLKVAKNGFDENDRIQPISDDNVALTNSADYSISAFVKNIDCTGVTTLACRTDAGSNELFRQGFQWTGASLALTSAKGSGTRTGAFVESYGNDWWRIGFTFTANSTAGNFELDIDRENGSATTSIETWGWQLEKGSYPTSYIPTYGVSATREKDLSVVSYTGMTESQGTLFIDLAEGFNGNDRNSGVASLGITADGDGSDSSVGLRGTGDDLQGVIRVNAVSYYLGAAVSGNARHKFCITWTASQAKIFIDGSFVETEDLAAAPAVFDTTELCEPARPVLASVNQFLTFPTALTDSECIALTTL
jgi:hypothetical protein